MTTQHLTATEPSTADRAWTLADVRDLAVIPVWSESGPSAGAILGLSRSSAYDAARRGDLPVIRYGGKVMVKVPALRRDLGDLPPDPEPHQLDPLHELDSAPEVQRRDPGVDPEPTEASIHAHEPAIRTSTSD